jgi:hypothetical protein
MEASFVLQQEVKQPILSQVALPLELQWVERFDQLKQ